MEGSTCGWNQIFMDKFLGQTSNGFFACFWPASLIESFSFRYGLKDPFPMHKLGIDSVVIDQKGTCY